MQNFKDSVTEQAWAFDDDVKASFQNGTWSFETNDGAHINTPTTLQPFAPLAIDIRAQEWEAYQAQAQALLDKSDVTILRCYENAVIVPAPWCTYRRALRAIVGAASGDPMQALPAKPSYPAGT